MTDWSICAPSRDSPPGRRYRDAELTEMGIDPSTARRQFKRYCGMTFQAYQRACRLGTAMRALLSRRHAGKIVLET